MPVGLDAQGEMSMNLFATQDDLGRGTPNIVGIGSTAWNSSCAVVNVGFTSKLIYDHHLAGTFENLKGYHIK